MILSFSITWSYYTKNHVYKYWFNIRIQIWENNFQFRDQIRDTNFFLPPLSCVSSSLSLSFSLFLRSPSPLLSPLSCLYLRSHSIVQAGIEFMNSWLLSWLSLLDGIANTHHLALGLSSSLLIPRWYDYFHMFQLGGKKWKSQREALS